MVILLVGTSELGRTAIAKKLTAELPKARHLPLEELQAMQVLEGVEFEGNEELFFRIACHCAREMEQEGFHLVISLPHHEKILPLLEEELDSVAIPVHLGTKEELENSDYPYTVDTNQHSVNDIFTLINEYIAEQTSAE